MRRTRRAVALISVLWVLAVLAVMSLGFSLSVRVNTELAGNAVREAQARELARAGLEMTVELIGAERDLGKDSVALTDEWMAYTSEDRDFSMRYGTFSVVVSDEAGKLDVNTATEDELYALLDDEELVAAIVDWRDADDDAVLGGSEVFNYEQFTPPYAPRNDRFRSIGEMALLLGMDPETLWGEERTLYAERELGEVRGLADLLTVAAIDSNLSASGTVRLNLNTATDDELISGLSGIITDDKIQALIQYRSELQGDSGGSSAVGGAAGQPAGGAMGGQTGAMTGGGAGARVIAEGEVSARQVEVGDGEQAVGAPTGAEGGATSGTEETEIVFETTGALLNVPGLAVSDVQAMWDYVTAVDADKIEGRVNINTAPIEVLTAVLGEEVAAEIVTQRDVVGSFDTVADLLDIRGDVRDQFEQISDRLTTRSYVLTIESTGEVGETGVVKKVRAMVDISGDEPNVLRMVCY